MNAVVTAGGRITGPLAEQTGQTIKCLIEFDGERLIDRVLRALHEAGSIERVCVVGPPEIRDSLPLAAEDRWLDDAGDGAANFLLGLRAFADDPVVLFATSDLPFINAEAIDQVASRGVAGAGLCYPYFSKAEVRAVFPHEANSYLKLRDGDITGSSVFLLGPQHILPREAEIRAFFEARKNIPKLVGMLGLDLALRMVLTKKFGLRVLTVAALERRFGKLAGFPVAALSGCSPRCSLDIDHERDLAEALAHVGQA